MPNQSYSLAKGASGASTRRAASFQGYPANPRDWRNFVTKPFHILWKEGWQVLLVRSLAGSITPRSPARLRIPFRTLFPPRRCPIVRARAAQRTFLNRKVMFNSVSARHNSSVTSASSIALSCWRMSRIVFARDALPIQPDERWPAMTRSSTSCSRGVSVARRASIPVSSARTSRATRSFSNAARSAARST